PADRSATVDCSSGPAARTGPGPFAERPVAATWRPAASIAARTVTGPDRVDSAPDSSGPGRAAATVRLPPTGRSSAGPSAVVGAGRFGRPVRPADCCDRALRPPVGAPATLRHPALAAHAPSPHRLVARPGRPAPRIASGLRRPTETRFSGVTS